MPDLFGVEVREYQRAIAKSALESNTLVVLPTGLGKTIIALLRTANNSDSVCGLVSNPWA